MVCSFPLWYLGFRTFLFFGFFWFCHNILLFVPHNSILTLPFLFLLSSSNILLFNPTFLLPLFTHPLSLFLSPCSAGNGAGSSGFSAGAFALCSSAGPRVDPQSMPVCCAGGLWHGLSGAEEVHPQGLSSQVGLKKKF